VSSTNSKIESRKVFLLIGTRKGALILSGSPERDKWQISDLHFKSLNVMNLTYDHRDARIYASVVHEVYGPSIHYSDDLGNTWTQARSSPKFFRESYSGRPPGTPDEARGQENPHGKPEEIIRIWTITPGRETEPGVLYAGVQPAALFKSVDRGETWNLNEGLYDHPHRCEWYPGAGGLCLHTIVLDPDDPYRMYAAISTGGCYLSEDGGNSWEARNRNVRADFMPNIYPEFGQCVHSLVMHPNRPQVLYQQNHCGVYRSDNGGEDWIDIGDGKLPSRFGFPIVVHPNEPETIFIVPEESDDFRVSIDGRFTVWRSKDAGANWVELSAGLPSPAHLVVLRQAMAMDTLENAGIYIGTSTGQIFYSLDNGDNWEVLADYLPPILSIETAIIPE